VKQNASNGTDHGTANNLFLINGRLKKGKIFNEAPNLTDLDEGDLKYTVDFRNIYATLLRKWLKVDDVAILGKKFDILGFV
ncbi:MAG: twin-arginine translocation pathway signal, partial [Bacteroidota bacterium]